MSAGYIGLHDAAVKWNEAKGSFMAYSEFRIKGAMMDEVRKIRVIKVSHGYIAPKRAPLIDAPAQSDDVINRLTIGDLYYLLPRTRKIIYMYHMLGDKQQEIARMFGIGVPRVSQILHDAYARIRAHLEG